MKTEHQRLAGTFQLLFILEWKWEHITMDFVSGSPHSKEGSNSIWVIVDRLTKSAHFLLIKSTCKLWQLAELFIKEIVRLHGVLVSIVSDKDPQFIVNFLADLHKSFGIKLYFSTAFHHHTDGKL